ncbi:hypothetical protein [Microbulbifer sp. JMSA003]|uniref:hypothetical protein n=1 Tax=Microbulbifer sp. JMSA003 TaxID=3243369 RepID=UPI00403911AA
MKFDLSLTITKVRRDYISSFAASHSLPPSAKLLRLASMADSLRMRFCIEKADAFGNILLG